MKKIPFIFAFMLSLMFAQAQTFNQNVTFNKNAIFKGRTQVKDTSFVIKSGTDTLSISIRKDSVYFRTNSSGFQFSPPLNTGTAWNLTGNAGTNPSTDFIGTTDGTPFVISAKNSVTAFDTTDIYFRANNFIQADAPIIQFRTETDLSLESNDFISNSFTSSGVHVKDYASMTIAGLYSQVNRANIYTQGLYSDSSIARDFNRVNLDSTGIHAFCFSPYDTSTAFTNGVLIDSGINGGTYIYYNKLNGAMHDSTGDNSYLFNKDGFSFYKNAVKKFAISPTGVVTIKDGTQGSGKVLTSDANGLATWQPAGTFEADSATIYALTPANGTQYYCTNCTGNGVAGRIVAYIGAAWRRLQFD